MASASAGRDQAVAHLGIGIHEGIRSRVIGLAGVAHGAGRGGKGDQEIQVHVPGRQVQIDQA